MNKRAGAIEVQIPSRIRRNVSRWTEQWRRYAAVDVLKARFLAAPIDRLCHGITELTGPNICVT